ncbi:MAG: DinB family protein [Phycisphaerae bacterium]
MHAELIDRYLAGADLPARGIAGLSRQELTGFPVAGTWSIQQVVLHLMDSDLIASDRMKRVIAEDHPLIIGYDETRFSQRLGYQQADAATACEVFRLNRKMTADMLRRLPAADYERFGIHNERGKVTLQEFVETYADHVHHHMKFVMEKRRVLGKPM